MKRLFAALMLVTVVALHISSLALADSSEKVRECPDSFHIHPIGDHDEHHGDHRHIGSDTDRNGDGLICVKHLGDKHLHIDNNKPQ